MRFASLTSHNPKIQKAMESPAVTCAFCQWFAPTTTDSTFGQCRFSAPTHDRWPTVSNDDWCGDWAQSSTNSDLLTSE